MTALATKTVVFVTHQIEFLPAADLILVKPSFIYLFKRIWKRCVCTLSKKYNQKVMQVCYELLETISHFKSFPPIMSNAHKLFTQNGAIE